MPVDWSRYPANWQDVRRRILQRATTYVATFDEDMPCCEWCGAPDRFRIVRDDPRDPAAWRCIEEDEALTGTYVVLTIAHLGTNHPDGAPGDKHDKHDVRPENLAALCQRCHLLYDIDEHVRNAAETRRRRRIEAGQAELFPMEAGCA